MEAASLGRGRGTGFTQSVRGAVRARSRVFWAVAGLTVLAALIRFLTLGVQSYHHDEVVTASRILRGSFGHAMDAVNFGESTPPLYYALAWVWTQVTGNTEYGLRSLSALAGVATVPVVFLVARELRDARAGLLAAALAALNPMLLWYSQEARAYSLVVLFSTVALFYAVRATRASGRRELLLWGFFGGLALATHYFAVFPLAAEAVWLLRRRGRGSLWGIAILAASGLALAPLALHQSSLSHAEWIQNLSLGHRVWESAATFTTGETGDIIGQPERPWLAYLPLALCLSSFALLFVRGTREALRAARAPLAIGLFAFLAPVALALVSPGKDYVLARNLIPALVPLLLVVAIALTMSSARRLGAVLAAALLAYSLAFCLLLDFDPEFQRPDWHGVAEKLGEPQAPRALVTWTIGEAPLRHYLSTGSMQLTAKEGYGWLVREVDFISEGHAPPPSAQVVGAGWEEVGQEYAGALFIRHYRYAGPGLAPLRIRYLRRAPLNFRSTGILLDGVGPS
jgi:mannosyltransferase